MHALERGAECGDSAGNAEGSLFGLCVGEYERTDRGVGAYIRTLVALDTVFFEPFGNESGNTALFVGGSALSPCAVGVSLEV